MEQETDNRAERLYERGLHAFAAAAGRDTRLLAAECWQEAWELYREQGDHAKAAELEILLINLYRRAATTHTEEPGERDTARHFSEWGIFFKIGCFGFGGPMAVFSLLEEELVHKRGILTDQDFLEGAVLGDVLPGPVTMDMVTYTGYKLRKWAGAAVSTLVFILPSFIIMLVLAVLYDRYSVTPGINSLLKCLGAAVTGLILSVGLKLTRAELKDYREACILIWSFASAAFFELDILVIVGLAGLVGVVLYYESADEQQVST